jgi:glycosyltransferase involved in cell wall biosynthesis
VNPRRAPANDADGSNHPQPEHEAAIGGARYGRLRRTHRSRGHLRPRVLQLLATGGNGGAQESYSGLLLRLDRAKYEVRALSLSVGSAVHRLRRLGLAVEIIDEPNDDAAVRELAAYLRREEIDLVHSHMFRAEVIGTRAAVAAGTPVVISTVHSSRVRSAADTRLLAELTPQIDRLIVPSGAIEHKVRCEGRVGAEFAVIPNGVDLSRFAVDPPPCQLRREYGIPREAVLLGTVARLEPEKGLRYLVEAMPSVLAGAPQAWLAIVGEGSERPALEAQAASLPAPARDRIIFAGRREDISAVTADLDVAVLPSLREAQGISLLEAMARCRPVVASAVGGIPEVVTDEVSGLLVPPADPPALADALVRLARSPELRARLGAAGFATVRDRYSIDAQVVRTEAVYDEELERAGLGGELRNVGPGSVATAVVPRERAALEVPPL